MIKKEAGGFVVYDHTGTKKQGGPYKTKAEAEKRIRQVEFYKNLPSNRDK